MIVSPLSVLSPSFRKAVIFLNNERGELHRLFQRLWVNATVTAFVDGFANHVYGCAYKEQNLPNFVTGDFDSITQEALEFYKSKASVSVIHTPDENETDFTKCLRIVHAFIEEQETKPEVIVGAHVSGGRLDHELGLIHTLYAARQITKLPVLLVSDICVSLLLSKGEHTINVNTGYEGEHVGIIPLGKPSVVTTQGLHWDIHNEKLSFETVISTCNKLSKPVFSVTCDEPVLLTLEYKVSDLNSTLRR